MRSLSLFYRELEECRFGLRPAIQHYYLIITFAFCSLLAGVIFGIEQGRVPSWVAQKEIIKTNEISAHHEHIKQVIADNFKASKMFPDYHIQSIQNGVEIHFGAAGLFISGQAGLTDQGEREVRALAVALKQASPKAEIMVESFTDDAPIYTTAGKYPTNWELSGARAASVLRAFLEEGIEPERLTFSGHGPTHPLVPNRDPSGAPLPENRLKNRRMLIRITPPNP